MRLGWHSLRIVERCDSLRMEVLSILNEKAAARMIPLLLAVHVRSTTILIMNEISAPIRAR